MRLPAHLGRLECDDVEDHAVGREQHVQAALEVVFGELVGQVVHVDAVMVSECGEMRVYGAYARSVRRERDGL